jgi:uncharacterized protein Usg
MILHAFSLRAAHADAKLAGVHMESPFMVAVDFKRQLEGYGLTTANILYRLPDHPALLQTYVWQNYDLAPVFPELRRFLDFWERELEGPLHSVKVAHRRLVSASEVRTIATEFRLN